MRVCCLVVLLVAVVCCGSALGQLVVFDNSHAQGHEMYDELKAHLEVWGYTVESRTTPLMDNGDADVIVILPEDAYSVGGTDFTVSEAAWLMAFVDSGKGLFAGMCLDSALYSHIAGVLDTFGIALGDYLSVPAYYNLFNAYPLFSGVGEMGDTISHCVSLDISSPSVAVAQDGIHDYIATYEPGSRQDGAAIWVSHYKMTTTTGMYDYDNLRFLSNAFAWLSHSEHVTNEDSSWGGVKKLYR
jgi:hypothetical protein